MTSQNSLHENLDYHLSPEDLSDVIYAYFSVTTREKVEYEIILIREGIRTLPVILDQTLLSIDRGSQTQKKVEDQLWGNDKLLGDNEKKWMDYVRAKILLDDTVDEVYEICRRFGSQLEQQLILRLSHTDSRVQLLCLILLYKFEGLNSYTIQKIKDFVAQNNRHKLISIYEQIVLILLYRDGDKGAIQYIDRKAREIGKPSEDVIQNTYYGILLELTKK